jgi:hypothetical protein
MMTTIIDYAYQATTQGIHIFPCDPKTKRPLITDWPNQATTNHDQIAYWWSVYPDAMIGAVTGHKSGFYVLDIDVKDGIDAFTKLEKLEAAYGKLDYTTMVKTPSGGIHLYIPMPDADIRNSAGKLGAGIDIRGNGGYVIYAGSVRADGEAYSIISGEEYHA